MSANAIICHIKYENSPDYRIANGETEGTDHLITLRPMGNAQFS